MSSNPAARTLRIPPANFDELNIPRTRLPARYWFRVHQSAFSALYFSLSAFHRYSHKDCPCFLLYAGIDIDTCLFERFGDKAYEQQKTVPKSLWGVHSVSNIQVPELRVCDLTNAKTLSALRVDLSALMHHDLATPQAWGLALQRHPARFQGLKFKSRFNGKACLALFQRDGLEKLLREVKLDSLLSNEVAVEWLDKHKISLY